MNRHRNAHQRGAAAVEFALVLPLLMAVLIGIMEFGYLLYLNGSAAGAAREGARYMAIHHNDPAVPNPALEAKARAEAAFTATTPQLAAIVTVGDCSPGGDSSVKVTVRYSYGSLTGALSLLSKPGGSELGPLEAYGEGIMRCGG